MTAAPAAHQLPMYLDQIEVADVRRLSPTFVRITFTNPTLAAFGVDGQLLDQRIKLVFPAVEGGPLPMFEGADATWLTTWIQRPVEERGHMRTFTVRRFVGAGPQSLLEVDFALHEGECGPAARWARRAAIGDRLVMLGPTLGQPYGGIEYLPGRSREVVLLGDETAVPAVSAILASDLEGRSVTAYLEVPTAADVLDIAVPQGCSLTWLPREEAGRGDLLRAAVAEHFGARSVAAVAPVGGEQVDPELWETPIYSSSGEDLGDAAEEEGGEPLEPYVWVAGESRTVTSIRRYLVGEVGLDRAQVAFMGYWREGVAMKS